MIRVLLQHLGKKGEHIQSLQFNPSPVFQALPEEAAFKRLADVLGAGYCFMPAKHMVKNK